MSLPAVGACPFICSGDMYWNVPRIAPSAVSAASVGAESDVNVEAAAAAADFASPKSSSFTTA